MHVYPTVLSLLIINNIRVWICITSEFDSVLHLENLKFEIVFLRLLKSYTLPFGLDFKILKNFMILCGNLCLFWNTQNATQYSKSVESYSLTPLTKCQCYKKQQNISTHYFYSRINIVPRGLYISGMRMNLRKKEKRIIAIFPQNRLKMN